MKAYRIAQCKYIEDLTGFGASIRGGRWNSAGQRLLYTSENSATSLLEHLVHRTPITNSKGYCMIELTIPESWRVKELTTKDLPEKWHHYPAIGKTKVIGDAWINQEESEILKVPSAIDHLSYNLLINVQMKGIVNGLKISKLMDLNIDKRLI